MADVRRSPVLNVMTEIAEKAGRSLIRDFGEVEQLQISKKGPRDFVSTADLKSEKLIHGLLKKARPKFGFLLEEGGELKGEDATTRWIVDPLDGTTNFLHGIPHWCVSIALEKDGEVIAGVVYDAIKDEMFWAEKGLGASVNNRRIHVAGRQALTDAVLVVGEDFFTTKQTAPVPCGGYRRYGAGALDLCYVAAGRFDAFWEKNLKPVDCAAAALIVREARGIVTDFTGGKDYVYGQTLLAANSHLHALLLPHFKGAGKTAKAGL